MIDWHSSDTVRNRIRLALAAMLATFTFAVPAHAADLKIMIDDVASSAGTVMVGLYDSQENYTAAIADASKPGSLADSRRVAGVALRAVASTQRVVFTDLKPGAYVVVVIHDENNNSKLDSNALGMPTESYGFSNDARGLFAAPDFKNAAITLDDADRDARITLFNPRQNLYPRLVSER